MAPMFPLRDDSFPEECGGLADILYVAAIVQTPANNAADTK